MTGVSKPGVDNTLQLIYTPTTDIAFIHDKGATPVTQISVADLNLVYLSKVTASTGTPTLHIGEITEQDFSVDTVA